MFVLKRFWDVLRGSGVTVGTLFLAAIPVLAAVSAGVGYAQAAAYGPSASAPGATLYFVDLKDGATIPPQMTIHFGLKAMDVAPAGSDRPNSGHHHLLVDASIPALDKPIPNDFNHLHFGRGQTQAELSLSPGDHTLQLLLADGAHVPHNPPVASERIHVKVVEGAVVAQASETPAVAPAAPPPAPAAAEPAYKRKPSPQGAKVYLAYPTNNATVPQKVKIRFGLIGMGVAPAGFDKANTGHHHLLIDTPLPPMDEPVPNDFHHLHFGLGQTEAEVELPLGKHTLQLLFADTNHMPHDPPVLSQPIQVNVTVDGKKPKPRRRKKH